MIICPSYFQNHYSEVLISLQDTMETYYLSSTLVLAVQNRYPLALLLRRHSAEKSEFLNIQVVLKTKICYPKLLFMPWSIYIGEHFTRRSEEN